MESLKPITHKGATAMYNIKDIPTAYRFSAKGSLIVKTVRDIKLGVSDTIIPKDTIGFVQGRLDDNYAVNFPWINKHGSIPKNSVEVIGRQPSN